MDADGRHRLTEDREIVIRRAEHGDAEEPMPFPTVADLVGQVRVAETQGPAPDDEQQVIGRRPSTDECLQEGVCSSSSLRVTAACVRGRVGHQSHFQASLSQQGA